MSPNELKARRDALHCAAAVMDTGLLVTRFVRMQIRRLRPGGLTMPQFRCLAFIAGYPDTGPSELADYIGISAAAATKQLKALEEHRLVVARTSPADRRRRTLRLTRLGKNRLGTGLRATRQVVAGRLEGLSADERAVVAEAMKQVQQAMLEVAR